MQFSIYMTDEDGAFLNSRLRREDNVSLIGRFALLAGVMTPQEMSDYCRAHPREAQEVQPYIIKSFEQLYGALVPKGERQ